MPPAPRSVDSSSTPRRPVPVPPEAVLRPKSPVGSAAVDHDQVEPPTLEQRIHRRIEKRLGARIRDLRISTREKTIVIEGRCATYHSKQLAQHAALGVIEDEQVENAIQVSIER